MSKEDSIVAYDFEERVKSYDADMDLMHPNRSKMVKIALEFLPFHSHNNLKVIDLGIGTGFFTLELLKKFPNSKVIGVDGAKKMIDLAKIRLKDVSDKVDFLISDFRDLNEILKDIDDIDLIISSYALHHMNKKEKKKNINIFKQ